MKLIKCHIEAFGKLRDMDLSLDKGITSLCFGNGYGKTTIISFIRAMLYGLKPVRANAKEFEDRRRLYPFEGGRFGGNLILEHGSDTYRIERFFDKKSEVKDELRVYRAGELTDALGDNIGQALLGIDAESFDRVILMSSHDEHYGTTHGISARLGGTSGEGDGFQSAYARLEARKKQLKAIKGRGGLISAKQDAIRDLQIKIGNLKDMQDELARYYGQRNKLSEKIAHLDEQERGLNSKRLVLEKRGIYARYLREIEENEARAAAITDRYPCDLLPEQACAELRQCIGAIERDSGAALAVAFDKEKEERLDGLATRLGDPSALGESVSAARAALERCAQIDAALQSESDHLAKRERFADGAPTDSELGAMKESAERYKELRERADAVIAGKMRRIPLLPMILGIVCATSGAALIKVSIPASAALLFVGVICLVLFIIFGSRAGGAATLTAEAGSIELRIREFLKKYGYGAEGHGAAVFELGRLEQDLAAYREDIKNAQRKEVERSRLLTERDALAGRTVTLLGGYGITCSPMELEAGVESLCAMADEYSRLLEERRESAARRRGFDSSIDSAQMRIGAILDGYSVIIDGEKLPLARLLGKNNAQLISAIDRMEADRVLLLCIQRDGERLRRTAESYRSYNGIDASEPAADITDDSDSALINDIAMLPELRDELARIDRMTGEIESMVEYLPEHEGELIAAKEALDTYLHEHRMIEAAMDALAQAEKNLGERFIAPIRDRFLYYASCIEKSIGESYVMDRELNVRFEAYGEERDERHLSQGQHAIVALALRLSLSDVMYGGEPPFILLDDPFASLDEKYFQKAAAVLKNISKTRQIVYFTCHNSRKI